jgi:hypothetical protein
MNTPIVSKVVIASTGKAWMPEFAAATSWDRGRVLAKMNVAW